MSSSFVSSCWCYYLPSMVEACAMDGSEAEYIAEYVGKCVGLLLLQVW